MLNINIACGSILWKQIPHLVFKAIRGLKSTLAFVQILQSVNHLAFKNSVKAAAVKTTFITYSLWDINLCDIVHQADCLEISVLLLTCYDFTCYDGPWRSHHLLLWLLILPPGNKAASQLFFLLAGEWSICYRPTFLWKCIEWPNKLASLHGLCKTMSAGVIPEL